LIQREQFELIVAFTIYFEIKFDIEISTLIIDVTGGRRGGADEHTFGY